MSGRKHTHAHAHTHTHKSHRGPPAPVKYYLLAYNAFSAGAWAYLLYLTVWFIITPRPSPPPGGYNVILGHSAKDFNTFIAGSPSLAGIASVSPWSAVAALADHLSGAYDFHGLGAATKYVQTAAVLEVVHALLGFVRSPVGTVASQVASRLWAVWGVVELVPSTHNNPLFATMLLAWSLTETIRYPFYFFQLLHRTPYILDYLRYTTFLVLYPLGAGSEAFLSFSTLPPLRTLPYVPRFFDALHTLVHSLPSSTVRRISQSVAGRQLLFSIARVRAAATTQGYSWSPIQLARLVLFFIWWPALYVLYTYMLHQRAKFFSKAKGSKSKGRKAE